MKKFDAVVIGGGPAGTVTAHSLARQNFRVLLIDPTNFQKKSSRKIGESLPAAARPLLRHLELLDVVENGSHSASYGNASAWGQDQLQTQDFILDPNGLGWHLNRTQFETDLRTRAENSGVEIWRTSLLDFENILTPKNSKELRSSRWRLKTDCGMARTPWLIDATGRGAVVARKIGASRTKEDSAMTLFQWFGTSAADTDSRTLVESRPEGWWYTSRLPDHSRVLSLQTDPSLVLELLHSPGLWQKRLKETRHIGATLHRAEPLTELRCVDASSAHLSTFAGDGWLAVGDAALSLDPISSQGLFNAIYTGHKAAQTITNALELAENSELFVRDFQDRLSEIHQAYLRNRRFLYLSEQRWPEEKFWQERHREALLAPEHAAGLRLAR